MHLPNWLICSLALSGVDILFMLILILTSYWRPSAWSHVPTRADLLTGLMMSCIPVCNIIIFLIYSEDIWDKLDLSWVKYWLNQPLYKKPAKGQKQ